MARVTVAFLRPSPLDESTSTSPPNISSRLSSLLRHDTATTNWSSRVFELNDNDAATLLMERRTLLQDYTRGVPHRRPDMHFNHQLLPSGAGPFDLLLRVDPEYTEEKENAVTSSTTTLTPTSTIVAPTFTAPNQNISTTLTTTTHLFPLKLTCRVGGSCIHFALDQCSAEVPSSIQQDAKAAEVGGGDVTECHLSRDTASHLRRLAARWCPVVSYCTAAAVAHPGWTDDPTTMPTAKRSVVVCPSVNGIHLRWIDRERGATTANAGKMSSGIAGRRVSSSKYVVSPPDIVKVRSTTFVFDVEKYCIRMMKEEEGKGKGKGKGNGNGKGRRQDRQEMLLLKTKQVSLVRRVMGACGGSGLKRSRRTADQRTKLPMTMDESRPHPLVSFFKFFARRKR